MTAPEPSESRGPAPRPRLGVAIPTIGRPALAEVLASLAASTVRPTAVAVANQSGRPLKIGTEELPFPVVVVTSEGGASAGRNDAVSSLGDVDVVCFPNDDSCFPPETLERVAACFATPDPPDAVAATLADPGGPRFVLPASGRLLDRRTVWRAVEPAMFVRREALVRVGGFRADLGTGAPSPWGSGEGTDLMLRILESGGRVLSRPDIVVLGSGERRGLTPRQLVDKHRAYARGTGWVYREHGYPRSARLRILVAPLLKALQHDRSTALSLRLAVARSLGRFEGLRGRPLGDPVSATWRPPPPE